MDEEIHGFATDILPPLNTRVRSEMPFIPNGSDSSAFPSSAFGEQKHHNKHHKKPDIAERGMDEEVHGFAADSLPPLNTRVRSTMPFIPNGSDSSAFPSSAFGEQKHHHKHHHQKHPDVAERSMDEEVQGFSSDATSPINIIDHANEAPALNGKGALTQHKKHAKAKDLAERGMDNEVYNFDREIVSSINGQERPDTPWVENGVNNQWDSFAEGRHHKKKHHHKGASKKPDVAERGMDEEVHGFVWHAIPPLNTRVKSEAAFVPNGSDPSAHDPSLVEKKHHNKDVAERGMDEEVHGLVWHALPPLNTRVKSEDAFIPNGSDPSAIDPSFAEKKHHKKDVAERGMDEEVHGFVWHALPPLNTRVKSEDAFIPNGSDPSAQDPSFAEKKHHKKPDVAERGMDEEVHGFVWHAIPPLNTRVKSEDAFVPNGSDPSAHDASLNQDKHHHKKHNKDVAERGMDEEVHGLVHHAIPPLNVRKRTDDPFIPNGSAIGDWDENANNFAQEHHHHKHHKKPDIAERGMDEDVWGFSSEALPPMTVKDRGNSNLPFIPNGSKNQYSQADNKPDIAERSMEDHFVHPFSAD
jgi:hypothetical protein